MRKIASVAAILVVALATAAFGQIKTTTLTQIVATAEKPGTFVVTGPSGGIVAVTQGNDTQAVFAVGESGSYTILLIGTDGNGKPVVLASYVETVGTGPQPKPVDPPNPQPEPKPNPTPAPPLPGDGLRVLLIEETGERMNLPQAQKSILASQKITDWLTENCAKDENGNPEYRFFDDDVDLGNQPDIWKRGMSLPRESLPWLIISNGKTGYTGPLPANVDDMLKLLEQYK